MFMKGYAQDAGCDIIMHKSITLPAFQTTIVELPVKYNPPNNTLAYLVQRTSAARKGIIVSGSPIDPGYEGNLYAICLNTTPYDVLIKKNESFCQLVVVPFKNAPRCKIKRPGEKRGEGAFGSSDQGKNTSKGGKR